ncbi:trimeric intracellular cation channel family protein [Lactococcus allomyrinae]|uniref:Trimeric intracellular cation channel family protein n=1 Tax=Lactococcus allomyrinae TaxID=2419773 RepID=A0A387BB29_9LACT|nr:trimeric intracellular cation channel family protein [Lactococcus allomyrinae]AYG00963.1 trimeric intracellular cation channel family protein [Lactococcus allomyrinae]
MINNIYLFFEILGTVAFAISGTVVGINHKLDVFGILVMSVITAVGGGIFRDLLLGIVPPTSLKSPFFIIISVIASITSMAIATVIKSKREAFNIFKVARFYNILLLVSDAIGLGIFTVLGIDAGIAKGFEHNLFFIVFLGVLTGVGGGMIRDIIANQVPMIFRENIYAVSCIIGGILYVILRPELNHYFALSIAVACIVFIRIISEVKKINLPRIEY